MEMTNYTRGSCLYGGWERTWYYFFLTQGLDLVTHGLDLLTRGLDLLTQGLDILTQSMP
jgi:hypothetical protein